MCVANEELNNKKKNKKRSLLEYISIIRFNFISSSNPCSVQIAEDENGCVIANVKSKPDDDHVKIAEDKGGYLIPQANQKREIYANDTDYCTVGDTNAGSSDSNGKDVTLIHVFVSLLLIFVQLK